jgi:hydroxyethylthiazole kinase-like uncharacterized protein yjeF
MLPLLSTSAMREADARAVVDRGSAALVAAAGTAVALECARLLGRVYGSRVAVVAGPGLNGADGRVCAQALAARGAHVEVVPWESAPETLEGYDLVVDAAFGLGCTRPYRAPAVAPGTIVVAVDLPSGVDADTGELLGEPPTCDLTVALGALKPAHLTGPAQARCGEVRLHGLGIVESSDDGVVEDADLAGLARRAPGDHKWTHAVEVLAGSALMPGAAALVCAGALAAGASMVRLATRGAPELEALAPEVVRVGDEPLDPRCRAVAAGPGLGTDAAAWLLERLGAASASVVLDADGLAPKVIEALGRATWVLTPHDGEYRRLTGRAVPANRLAAARQLAGHTGCVVLLKGPTTVVASPEGRVRVVTSGTPALATAGSGDVLTGMIAALLAYGQTPLEAAALAAHLHGRAGSALAPTDGAAALPAAVAAWLARRA